MTTSQNGWPAIQHSDSKLLHKWVIPDTERYLLLRNGSAGFLLAHMALWFHEEVQHLDIHGQHWDEWGWAYRDIRDSNELSNHASGTAMDLNATLYPLGTTNMSRERRHLIEVREEFYHGCIRWGGDYSGRKDQQHFEINKALQQVEHTARSLLDSQRGERILKANPGQKHVILS